jgi:hypothetical protein
MSLSKQQVVRQITDELQVGVNYEITHSQDKIIIKDLNYWDD